MHKHYHNHCHHHNTCSCGFCYDCGRYVFYARPYNPNPYPYWPYAQPAQPYWNVIGGSVSVGDTNQQVQTSNTCSHSHK